MSSSNTQTQQRSNTDVMTQVFVYRVFYNVFECGSANHNQESELSILRTILKTIILKIANRMVMYTECF